MVVRLVDCAWYLLESTLRYDLMCCFLGCRGGFGYFADLVCFRFIICWSF